MKVLLSVLITLLAAFSLSIVNLIIINILPPGGSYINILFIVCVILLLGWEWRGIIFLALGYGFFLELAGAPQPGVIMMALAFGAVVMSLLYQRFFTNRSWYSAMALTLAAVAAYRLAHLLLTRSVAPAFFADAAIEAIASALIAAALTAALSFFSPRFQTAAKTIVFR